MSQAGERIPFPSFRFPGRNKVTEREIADKLECSKEHIVNLIRQKQLKGRWIGPAKGNYHIDVADWEAFILARLT